MFWVTFIIIRFEKLPVKPYRNICTVHRGREVKIFRFLFSYNRGPIFEMDKVEYILVIPSQTGPNSRSTASALHNVASSLIYHLHERCRACSFAASTFNERSFLS